MSRLHALLLPVVLLLGITLAACGGAAGEGPTATPTAEDQHEEQGEKGEHAHESGSGGGLSMGHVVLTEWDIESHDGGHLKSLPAGDVLLEVHNDGKERHRLAVYRGGEVAGDRVEGGSKVAETELIAPGDLATVDVHLEPAEYVLVCAVPGHIEKGMHARVHVGEHAE